MATACLAACAPLATVTEIQPRLPVPSASVPEPPALTTARMEADSLPLLLDREPELVINRSLSAARLSLNVMRNGSPSQVAEATVIYNFSIARLVDALNETKLKPWQKPVKLEGTDGDSPLWLELTSDSPATFNPTCDKLETTDRLLVGGKYFTEQVCLPGVGAPLVCTGPGRMEPLWTPVRHFVPATALLTFSGHQARLRIVNPFAHTEVSLAGKVRPLAADLSTPIAVNLVTTRPDWLGVWALLNPTKYEHMARLVMMDPYRPDAIPVVFIHGLMDTPMSWVPEINALNANPELRKKYQVWYFQYPTAPPFPISAEILREDLGKVYAAYPQTPRAVLVGHSLGGLLAHLQMCDSGTQYCFDLLGKPVDQLRLGDDRTSQQVRGALQFTVNPHVSRVVFEATPHRGADMAADPLGRIGSMLVKLPVKMITAGTLLMKSASSSKGEQLMSKFPNVIDTLRPKAKVIIAMEKLRLNPNIPYYSIIGDEGDTEIPRQDSTDGVVPYWSSHLEGARSETMVPYDHSEVPKGAASIAELQRILLEK